MYRQLLLSLLTLSLITIASHSRSEEGNAKLEDFDWRDSRYQNKQRGQIEELARRYLGTQLKGNRQDLDTLQRLIYKGTISKTNREGLQALGVVLGDVMAKELKLDWKIYIDKQGRSRALCTRESQECLFPITMLSRRIEVGLIPDVLEIYQKAQTLIEPNLDKLPYQID